jgi:RimJ/RimL family protein N-acetyltransferase
MKLVENSMKHWTFIRELRNDPRVKTGFINQRHIGNGEHAEHMWEYGGCYYVCLGEYDEEDDWYPQLGYCGVIEGDIRVAVSPEHQGKGVGAFMINELMKLHPDAFAKVKIDNAASLALFEKCGFKKKYYILERE